MMNNILNIDLDRDFLDHFRHRSPNPGIRDGFVGIGMLADALVRFAYFSKDPEMLKQKKYVIDELVKTQEPNGYIGIFTPEMRNVWHIGDEDVAFSRDAVTKALTSEKIKEVISRRKIKLIGYKNLKPWQ